MGGSAVQQGTLHRAVGAAHGSGSNHGNSAPPCLPTEPRGKESVEAFRERMDRKRRARGGLVLREQLRAAREREYGDVDDELADAKYSSPDLDVAPHRGGRPRVEYSQALRARLAEEYRAGAGMLALSSAHNLGQATVRRLLLEAGVQLRPRGQHASSAEPAPALTPAPEPPAATAARPVPGPRPVPRPPVVPEVSQLQRDRAASLTAFHAGDTIEQIAQRLERTPATVRSWLVAAGVELPARRPRPDRVRPCASCGRATRPASSTLEQCPDTVVRERDGMCSACVSSARRGSSTRRPIDAAETAQIVAAYEAGQSAPQIAESTGRTPATIRNALDRAGVARRDDRATRAGRRPKTADQDDPAHVRAFVDAYQAGQSISSIVESVKGASSTSYVRNVLVRAGVRLRPSAAQAAAARAVGPEVLPRVLELLHEGLTHAQIGQAIGHSQSAVSRWIRQHNRTLLAAREPADLTLDPPAAEMEAPAVVTPEQDLTGDHGDHPEPLGPVAALEDLCRTATSVVTALLDAAATLSASSRQVAAVAEQANRALDAIAAAYGEAGLPRDAARLDAELERAAAVAEHRDTHRLQDARRRDLEGSIGEQAHR